MAGQPEAAANGERLHKALARAGWGSRREIERLIAAGRVRLNGQVAAVGSSVQPGDRVQLDKGRDFRVEPATPSRRVLAYHKPVGEVCSRDDERGRKNVFARLPRLNQGRWINIGRLDINTSGLLLFTDDGELAHRLMHPRNRVDREYAARVFGTVDDDMLTTLRNGVDVDGELLKFDDIEAGKAPRHGDADNANRWFYCVLQSGKNREVRRLWESQGLQVSRLMRVRFGNIMLPLDLRPGRHVEIGGELLSELCRLVGLPAYDEVKSAGRRRAGPRRAR